MSPQLLKLGVDLFDSRHLFLWSSSLLSLNSWMYVEVGEGEWDFASFRSGRCRYRWCSSWMVVVSCGG